MRLLELSHGRAFVLFTSYSQMRQIYDRVSLEIPPELFIDSSRYHARARIMRPDSSAMFSTRQGVPVLTMGAGDSVEVVVGMGM